MSESEHHQGSCWTLIREEQSSEEDTPYMCGEPGLSAARAGTEPPADGLEPMEESKQPKNNKPPEHEPLASKWFERATATSFSVEAVHPLYSTYQISNLSTSRSVVFPTRQITRKWPTMRSKNRKNTAAPKSEVASRTGEENRQAQQKDIGRISGRQGRLRDNCRQTRIRGRKALPAAVHKEQLDDQKRNCSLRKRITEGSQRTPKTTS